MLTISIADGGHAQGAEVFDRIFTETVVNGDVVPSLVQFPTTFMLQQLFD